MFQLFSRARADHYFNTRSARRDAETDHSRVEGIAQSIESALTAAKEEWSGLNRRVEDALVRAAVTFGNDSDEYLTRDSLDNHHQRLFETEIAQGQCRLEKLSQNIRDFTFLKIALATRFPDFKAPTDNK